MLLLVAVGLETDAAVSHPVDKGLFLLIISFPGAGGGGDCLAYSRPSLSR